MESGVFYPNQLDSPLQFLFWEMDEVTPFFIFAVFWAIFDRAILLLFGVILSWAYSRFKGKYPKGIDMHLFWYIGLKKLQCFPPGIVKKYNE